MSGETARRGATGLVGLPEPDIFSLSRPGRRGVRPPRPDTPEVDLAAALPGVALRSRRPGLPEVAENQVVRHFTRLSQMNYAVDTGFYPLGSCTMKHNPRINEEMASLPGFAHLHPRVPEEAAQGALRLLWELERDLCEISGMARVSLQPAAGAQGELCGMLIVRAYHAARGERRTKVIVPDSAHGTNPATAAMAGFDVVEVPSDARGGVDVEALRGALDGDVAALMLTNPNTLGLFDENIREIADMVHEAGGLLYYDGANANAILGISRPGDMGFDVVHFNLHKTFSTPHGMGGPGSGPVGVREPLVPFLPTPLVTPPEEEGGLFRLEWDRPRSIGRLRSAYGNFGVLVRAYAYIRAMGGEGLRRASEDAVLNANYLMRLLAEDFDLPYDRVCKHEFVLSAANVKRATGARALDIAKRLLDYGYHPPTVYFPLIVEEAMMIEPTETETKETLDDYAECLRRIVAEARENPEILREAPTRTPVRRLDEARAARRPVVRIGAPERETGAARS